MLIVDAANVIGSRPTGWWRDRPGAAGRFTERVRATVSAGQLDPPVTIVLEGRFRQGAPESLVDGVAVVPLGAVGPGEGGLVDRSVQAASPRTVAAAAARSVRRPIRRPAEERDRSGSCRGAEGMSAILTDHAVTTAH